MPTPTLIEFVATALFALALLHTFSTQFFEHLARTQPRHAGIWHLLGEVEVVFGFWALVFMLSMLALSGQHVAANYLDTRNFTEPLFVFAIMVVAATRPILQIVAASVRLAARALPLHLGLGSYFLLLAWVPLMGSLITEPAAMTLAALMLRETLFAQHISTRLKYITIGVLFVNISVGGTLTPFAAPAVLMVAAKWNWDLHFMLTHFGLKAVIITITNAALATFLFRRELKNINWPTAAPTQQVPWLVTLVHFTFLISIVLCAHHPAAFMGLFLFFLGFTTAYQRYQQPLILREALLVAFFLAGLIVLGGLQQWWLQPLLMGMNEDSVFVYAMLLTAVTDNAALTYLGSLVDGLSPHFQIALVTGAVTGGGLTVIANAPNPAGFSLLRDKFPEAAIHPAGLALAALLPTLVAALIFRYNFL